MRPSNRKHWLFYLTILALPLFSGCAGRNYLLVDYKVPAESRKLQGQIVHLEIKDLRETQTIMTSTAATAFPEFSDTYSLAWAYSPQNRTLAGEHQLRELLRTTFEKRLAAEGIGLTDDTNATVANLSIQLKKFTLDLNERKWIAEMEYDAVLTAEGHPTASETVRGSAERARVIGRKGADTVVSDIFSDVVNRLNLTKLFENAQLAP